MNKKHLKILEKVFLAAVIVFSFYFCFRSVIKNIDFEDGSAVADIPSGSSVKVSIIVPVYNTSKYLEECLDSLENQTLKEIEIICVNDGSTDNSLEILKEREKLDSRIKIIDKKNAGVSAARNSGMEIATGDYIAFADSDDIVLPFAYEKMYNEAVKYKVNVVCAKLCEFTDGESVDLNPTPYYVDDVTVKARMISENPLLRMVNNAAFVTTKIYNRKFLNKHGIRFKAGVTHYEDGLFNFLCLSRVFRVVEDDSIMYLYRINRPGSAVTEFNAKKVLKASTTVSKEIVDNFELFNFNDGCQWVVSKILDLNYKHITVDTKDVSDKKYFAEIVVDLIENKLEKEKGVKLLSWQRDQLNNLKSILN